MRRFRAFAKFNLYLAVLGRRADGYHEIDTALQSIDLADDLFCEPRPDGQLVVECDAPGVPAGSGNLVWKGLALLREKLAVRPGMTVRLEKRIPGEAGLGGGSSDAACAMCAADRIWGLGLSPGEVETLAAEVGSDVAYFVRGGTRRCRGRGEKTEALPALPPSEWLIVKPRYGLPTREVYAGVKTGLTPSEANINMLLGCLAKRDLAGAAARMFNDLESAAMGLRPEAGEIKAWMLGFGAAGVTLAGSGSAWVGLCAGGFRAEDAAREAGRRGWQALPARSTEQGWTEVHE